VEELISDLSFNPVRSGFNPVEFPVMGTLDPYGDTVLNYLQCDLLVREVRRGTPLLKAAGVGDEFVLELVRLYKFSAAKPHRRLVFIGD
jgi:hypothetical protein